MPAQQLLEILNERLRSDLGPDAIAYSMDQLYAQIGSQPTATENSHDWASLRKTLIIARRQGILDTISDQVINDFAVIFSLNSRQALGLKDIISQAKESNHG